MSVTSEASLYPSETSAQRTRLTSDALGDLRFRALLPAEAWAGLPSAVRRRFSKRLGGVATVVYSGRVTKIRRHWIGAFLVQVARLVGGPLPTARDVGVPATVAVTEDPATQGQLWTRVYGRRRGFPQVIHSAKRFQGPTGLEEYLGHGIGMALRIEASEQALVFHSDHFFIQLAGLRLRLPRWLGPGQVAVSHIDRGNGTFAFVLQIDHSLIGEIFHQTALFADPGAPAP